MDAKLTGEFNPLCDMTGAQRVALQEKYAPKTAPLKFVDTLKLPGDSK